MSKKKIITVLMLIFVILLAGCTKSVNENVLIKVDDKIIDADSYIKEMALYEPSYEMQFGKGVWDTELQPGETFRQRFQADVLDRMLKDTLMLKAANKDGIVVSDDEVNKNFKQYKDAIAAQPDISKAMEEKDVNDDFIKEVIKKDMIVNAYIDKLSANYTATDADAEKYYNENKDKFTTNTCKASHILFSTINDKNEPLPEEETAKKEKLAREVLKRVQNGEDFAALAKQYSDDSANKDQGGELGYFDEHTMVKPFSDAAFAMQPGEISKDLVRTDFGFHIIKVEDRKSEVQKFEDVKEAIKSNLQYEKVEKTVNDLEKNAKIERYDENIKKAQELAMQKIKSESDGKDAAKPDENKTETK